MNWKILLYGFYTFFILLILTDAALVFASVLDFDDTNGQHFLGASSGGKSRISESATENSNVSDKLISPEIRKKAAFQDKPKIIPSDVLEQLEKHKKSNPKISARELADYGNNLIGKIGYQYSFYTCETTGNNKSATEDNSKPFDYQFTDLNGVVA